MQVAKWGNSLAVRLPADLVRALDLREGDHIDLRPDPDGFAVARQPRPAEILAGLRRFRGRLAAGDRLDRDGANSR
ncbi:AbrB/MazE/SpoVT family DNA-binding domain-containing protein [Paracoccus sp. YIM 132242]|uniref:AbrB/MazE/SpoVT family DNA-binding domain-containing protein n=1 Tax=Paracoccus lichenicola TaxID=2665644 RepID=A0A6L6HQP9_9RHOB|nr:AbrB/MazE/SpoVT family DNA-binding domain-containing protein [Paracoccus lichenicola]MTE01504.1 AbrB/MazE/SpoVT family DNA-binding domain-containing protein [Paracoccus lichenicola]